MSRRAELPPSREDLRVYVRGREWAWLSWILGATLAPILRWQLGRRIARNRRGAR
jgi:hypothetical protein